jgi:hypothetical protein
MDDPMDADADGMQIFPDNMIRACETARAHPADIASLTAGSRNLAGYAMVQS